jgi:hypothetical protein
MRRPTPSALVLALSLTTLAPACGSSEEPSPEPPTASPAAQAEGASEPQAATQTGTTAGSGGGSSSGANVEALPSELYASESLGSIRGFVRFVGKAPERFKIVAQEKPECCKFPDIDHLSELVIVNDGKLQNVLVRVTRGYDAAQIPPPPAEPALLDQRGCTYVPHVLAVQAGRTILVANSDPTNHNVNCTARKNDISSNRNVGEGQDPLSFLPTKEELSVRFKCDIHPWMGSWLHVLDNPWFAVSDAQGAFEIRDLPPGKYALEFVHEEYGKKTAKDVVVEAGKATVRAISYP